MSMLNSTTQVGQTDLSISRLGFGGASLYGLDDAQVARVLETAEAGGVHHFDTAPHYGLGEAEALMGTYLRSKPRSSYTISNKVGRIIETGEDGQPARRYDFTYDGVMRSVEDSRKRTGIDRFDILLAHDIDGGISQHGEQAFVDLVDSGWRALAELKASGDTAALGIGVNIVPICHRVLDHLDLDIILVAGRYTLLDQEAGATLLPRCRQKHVSIMVGGVMNTGILATGAIEGALYQYRPAEPEMLEKTRRIEAVCAQFGVRLPAAAQQFVAGHPVIGTLLVAAPEPAMVQRNLDDLAAPIPPEFWQELDRLGLARHYSLDQP